MVANLPSGETPTSSRFILACYSGERGGLKGQIQQLCKTKRPVTESSKDVIVVEDNKPAVKMTEQAGESCHDRVKRSQSRDSSPELFSDPAECGDGIADSGGSREHAESGMSSNNATNAKEEDASRCD